MKHIRYDVREPGSVILREWNAQRQASRAPRRARREFTGAQMSRLTESWTTQSTHLNQELWRNLRVLRARSRELARNNDFAKAFLRMVKSNVVGAGGMSLQVHALRADGSIDDHDSGVCEAAFKAFGKLGNIEVTGRHSRAAVERLIIETVARDGEILVRRLRKRGPHNYQVQLIDPALLDESLKCDLANGNKVRMGVELDSWKRAVAYHLVSDDMNDLDRMGSWTGKHIRVPAEEIWHLFVSEYPDQIRGVPWMSTALIRMNMLGGYEEAAVIAARLGASQMLLFESKDGQAETLADNAGEAAADPSAELSMDIEPGQSRVLPPGFSVSDWKPQYPHEQYGDFVKWCLRGAAAGLGVSYHGWAGDLESVNFSSARVGMVEEREVWKALQVWMIESFNTPLYSEWLPNAMLSGALDPLPFTKLAKFDAAVWQGRRWPYIEPLKDAQANDFEIANGTNSRTRIIRDRGDDPDEIWRELELESARLKKSGVIQETPGKKPGVSTSGGTNDDQNN
jgi:lambda family phage portal protein